MSIFDDVKSRVTMENAVNFLGLKLTSKKGDQCRYPCPACKGTDKHALSVNLALGKFRCFSWDGGKGGSDAIALVAHVKGCSQREAAEMLERHFVPASASRPVPSSSTQPRREGTPFDVEAYAKRLDASHEAIQSLGISPETLTAWKAGYCATGMNAKRLALPLEDANGTVVGYFGVALEDETPRLKFPSNVDPKEYIFGAARIDEESEVRIVRDVLDVLGAYEVGERAVCFLTEHIEASQFEALVGIQDAKKLSMFL